MKVAVFGASGFVGEYILNELRNKNHQPYALVRYGSENKIRNRDDLNIIYGDFSNPTAVEQTMLNVEAIIYNVGIIREFKSKGITFEKLHFEYLKKTVDMAKKLNIKRFILMSANGVKEVGTGYQTTKYKAEQYLKNSGLNWTIFRPSLIFGDSVDKQEFCKQLKRDMLSLPFPAPLFHKGILPIKAGTFRMSPIHVKDVATIFVKSLTMDESISKTFELGGESKTWKEIVKLISDACDKNKVFIPAPVIPIKIVASLLDRFSWFPISRDQLTMLLEGNECDSSDVFELFEIDKPIGFSLENLSYLSDEADE